MRDIQGSEIAEHGQSSLLKVDDSTSKPVLASRVFVSVDLALKVCTRPPAYPCKIGMDMQHNGKVIQ